MTLFTERWHFSVAWVAWLVLFAVIEAWAIWGKAPRATLSSHVRDFFDHQPWWMISIGVLFFVWLTLHFFLDLKSN